MIKSVKSARSGARAASVATLLVMCSAAFNVVAAQGIPDYLKVVVSRVAPLIIEETGDDFSNVEAKDHILRVDFDGNVNGADNYDNAYNPAAIVNGEASVYYSAIETGPTSSDGYYFIGYYFYHPQDGGASFWNGPINTVYHGHEHDMEGAYFVIRKSEFMPWGTIQAALTQAHGALIPFRNPDYAFPDPAGDNWMGYIRYWTDMTFNNPHPVVVVRSRSHGTYMAQDCSGATPQVDLPSGQGDAFGMWLNAPEQLGTYRACIHSGTNFVLYDPVPIDYAPSSGYSPQRLGPSAHSGVYLYGLLELTQSPIWQQRNAPRGLEYGNVVGISDVNFGYDSFYASGSDHGGGVDPNDSGNTPWQWKGGTGQCHQDVQYECWYTFGRDGTGSWEGRRHWPESPTTGQLFGNPETEMQMRFPFLSGWGYSWTYNPYVVQDPPPEGGELSVSIEGPTSVAANVEATWTASVTGGTAPYTYWWSGVMGNGNEVSLTSVPTGSGDLYLDVYDATGAHLAVSQWIDVTQDCGGYRC